LARELGSPEPDEPGSSSGGSGESGSSSVGSVGSGSSEESSSGTGGNGFGNGNDNGSGSGTTTVCGVDGARHNLPLCSRCGKSFQCLSGFCDLNGYCNLNANAYCWDSEGFSVCSDAGLYCGGVGNCLCPTEAPGAYTGGSTWGGD
jgi:hypothetical protein